MDLTKKISKRELRLILLFISLLIIFISYRFYYKNYSNSADKLKSENLQLMDKLKELQLKEQKKDAILIETKDLDQRTSVVLSKFAVGFTPEKSTVFIQKLEDYAGMRITSITFGETMKFYSDAQTKKEQSEDNENNEISDTADTAAMPDDSKIMADTTADTIVDSTTGRNADTTTDTITNTDADVNTNKNSDKASSTSLQNISCYQTTVTLSYQSTYEGLKKGIEYINNNEEKMNISDLTAAFDSTTGNLAGTMTIHLYAVNGTGKKYLEPQIAGLDIGTDNIFGTFELPVTGGINQSKHNLK